MKMHFIAASTEVRRHRRRDADRALRPCRHPRCRGDRGPWGDGLMLSVMHQNRGLPVYGMNRGTVGFLMNSYSEDALPERIRSSRGRPS